jgi:hypothetical protein
MKKLVIAMTFKGLRKFVPMNSSQQGRQQQITLFSSRVCDKPFWAWNIEDQVADLITNGDFCFNHIIALPKNAQNKPSLILKRFYFILFNNISIYW